VICPSLQTSRPLNGWMRLQTVLVAAAAAAAATASAEDGHLVAVWDLHMSSSIGSS
jgi:hypothetical protein